MARKSSIEQLDPRIQEAVNEAIRDGRATIDEIVEMIGDMGGEASRSAVGRYVKSQTEHMQQYREAQQMAKTWMGQLTHDPDSDVGRLLAEIVRSLAYQYTARHGAQADSSDLMRLARMLKDVASADKITTDRSMKIRQETAKAAADKAEKVAKKGGMSAETVDQIKREILGVA